MLVIKTPSDNLKERKYILHIIFNEFLDIEFCHKTYNQPPIFNIISSAGPDHNKSFKYNPKNDKPYETKKALKMVLPLQNNSYYYPKFAPSYNLLKRYNWECHLILPSI